MQITGVAQSCQTGNQAEFTRRGHVSTDQQKLLHRKTFLGSENFQSTIRRCSSRPTPGRKPPLDWQHKPHNSEISTSGKP